MGPRHQGPDQAPALVGREGGDQLDLPGRELDDAGRVAYAQLLVEQRSGRDDSFAVHDDGDGVEAGVRVADHQAQVVGIGRVTPRRQ